jgi:hypothetical protein
MSCNCCIDCTVHAMHPGFQIWQWSNTSFVCYESVLVAQDVDIYGDSIQIYRQSCTHIPTNKTLLNIPRHHNKQDMTIPGHHNTPQYSTLDWQLYPLYIYL